MSSFHRLSDAKGDAHRTDPRARGDHDPTSGLDPRPLSAPEPRWIDLGEDWSGCHAQTILRARDRLCDHARRRPRHADGQEGRRARARSGSDDVGGSAAYDDFLLVTSDHLFDPRLIADLAGTTTTTTAAPGVCTMLVEDRLHEVTSHARGQRAGDEGATEGLARTTASRRCGECERRVSSCRSPRASSSRVHSRRRTPRASSCFDES